MGSLQFERFREVPGPDGVSLGTAVLCEQGPWGWAFDLRSDSYSIGAVAYGLFANEVAIPLNEGQQWEVLLETLSKLLILKQPIAWSFHL